MSAAGDVYVDAASVPAELLWVQCFELMADITGNATDMAEELERSCGPFSLESQRSHGLSDRLIRLREALYGRLDSELELELGDETQGQGESAHPAATSEVEAAQARAHQVVKLKLIDTAVEKIDATRGTLPSEASHAQVDALGLPIDADGGGTFSEVLAGLVDLQEDMHMVRAMLQRIAQGDCTVAPPPPPVTQEDLRGAAEAGAGSGGAARENGVQGQGKDKGQGKSTRKKSAKVIPGAEVEGSEGRADGDSGSESGLDYDLTGADAITLRSAMAANRSAALRARRHEQLLRKMEAVLQGQIADNAAMAQAAIAIDETLVKKRNRLAASGAKTGRSALVQMIRQAERDREEEAAEKEKEGEEMEQSDAVDMTSKPLSRCARVRRALYTLAGHIPCIARRRASKRKWEDIRSRLKSYAKRREWLVRTSAASEQAWRHFSLGLVLELRGEFKGAARHFHSAVQLWPRSQRTNTEAASGGGGGGGQSGTSVTEAPAKEACVPGAFAYHLAICAEALGDRRTARRLYRRALKLAGRGHWRSAGADGADAQQGGKARTSDQKWLRHQTWDNSVSKGQAGALMMAKLLHRDERDPDAQPDPYLFRVAQFDYTSFLADEGNVLDYADELRALLAEPLRSANSRELSVALGQALVPQPETTMVAVAAAGACVRADVANAVAAMEAQAQGSGPEPATGTSTRLAEQKEAHQRLSVLLHSRFDYDPSTDSRIKAKDLTAAQRADVSFLDRYKVDEPEAKKQRSTFPLSRLRKAK